MEGEMIYFAVVAGVAICISLTALIVACLALSYVVGLKHSTHKIEWVPVDPKDNDDFLNPKKEVVNED